VIDRADDLALSGAQIVTLDVPSYWGQEEAQRFLAA